MGDSVLEVDKRLSSLIGRQNIIFVSIGSSVLTTAMGKRLGFMVGVDWKGGMWERNY